MELLRQRKEADIMFRKMSIRTRVTLYAAIVLVVVSVVITFGILGVSHGKVITYAGTEYFRSGSMDGQGEIGTESTGQNIFITDTGDILTGVFLDSLWIMAVSIFIGIIFISFAVKHALHPISELSQTISDIDEKKLNKPLPLPLSKDEIAELTKSFNRMMAGLNCSFEAQKHFSATAAHELKTPLSSIIANVEVLELDEKPSYEECLETIAIVKENAIRMEQLVLDLLTTYTNEWKMKTEICDIRKSCEKSCAAYKKRDNNNITATIDGTLTVQGDSGMLDRVVDNLIGNAFRYNRPNGCIKIILGANSLMIKDTGIGIPTKDLDKIFEPFYRVDISRARLLGGSGLGLSIVKAILDAHQASIAVESEENKGTTFIIHFTKNEDVL